MTATGSPVPGIRPCLGWVLHFWEDRDGDGFWTKEYVAVRGEEERGVSVCRFKFSPTQERFDWLVRSGFPPYITPTGGISSWTDAHIDARIRARDLLLNDVAARLEEPAPTQPVPRAAPGQGASM